MSAESQGTTTERAKEQVQEKAQVAQEKLKDTAGTMQSRAREQVDRRSTHVGEQMSSSAQALRTTSERLREQGQDGQARAAERAADQAERLGGYLKESDADRILNDVEDFGRRQPWAVAAAGLAAGFLASRFLKASSRNRYSQREWPEREWPTVRESVPAGPGTPGMTTPVSPATGTPQYGQFGTS
jgi:hypothetical protein